jgi:hypothetical protein
MYGLMKSYWIFLNITFQITLDQPMDSSNVVKTMGAVQKTVNSHGFNYQLTLGFEMYSSCTEWEVFVQELLVSFPKVRREQLNFLPSTEMEFWQTIDTTLLYEKHAADDYALKPGSIDKIRPLVDDFKQAISSLISPGSDFYHCDLPEGIPGYPVWWDFCFVIDTKSHGFCFVYGSASD